MLTEHLNPKMSRLLSVLPPPYNPKNTTTEQINSYEKENKIVFPKDYKDFIALYGCGVIDNVDIKIYSPLCNMGSDTFHEYLILNWEKTEDQRESNDEYGTETISLFPNPHGLYEWGHYGYQMGFEYATDVDGWKICNNDYTVQFSIFRVEPNFPSFLDFIYEEIAKYKIRKPDNLVVFKP